MLFPLRKDYRVLSTSWAHSTKYTLQLSREFWLDSIMIGFQFTAAASAITGPTADNYAALLKSARLSITDASGNRKVLDVTGSALLEFHRNVVGSLDRNTLLFTNTTATPAAIDYTIWFPIWFRHPTLGDPIGQATMLPLPRLSNDPILEIEVGSAAEVSSNTATVVPTKKNLIAVINRRDVLVKDFPYIPSELITYTKQWNSAGGKQDWEIPQIGTVTGILHQDYNGGTSALANRKTVLGSGATSDEYGQDWSIEYLSSVIRRTTPGEMQAVNDYTQDLYPATWINQGGSYYWDFLTDFPGQDAFSLGSALDLNPLSLNGGKARVIGSSLVTTASSFTNFTVHKLFGDLRQVKFV